jgi:hypothetical protein
MRAYRVDGLTLEHLQFEEPDPLRPGPGEVVLER